MKLDNWVFFDERVVLPITTENLYTAYKMDLPPDNLIDEKMKERLGQYLLDPAKKFDFNSYRENYIIMYLSISPKLREGWSKEYGLYRAALEIASEESIGTWDPALHTILPSEMDACTVENMKILEAKVIGLNFQTGMAAIAYPIEGFELGSLPQMLSVVIGNYTGMASTAWGVRFEDMDIPDKYANSFDGPLVGNTGIKQLLGDQMTVGTIVKPKTGLSPEDWAKTAYRSFLHGLDVVKDDENLTDQDYCHFETRARLVFEKMTEVTKETGRNLIYVPNVTSGTHDEMIKRSELIKSLGGNCLMIDILAAGMTAVQTLRKKFPSMIMHGHRAGHGAQTLFPELIIDGKHYDLRHGVSMKVWTLIARLAGIDQFHIGAPKGKMEANYRTVLENLEACTRPLGKLKQMRPICSGGLKATVLWDVAKIMNPVGNTPNQDIICQAGGGTHSHDLGTVGGAKSMVQARDAIMRGISSEQTMKTHFETLLAFRKWDRPRYGNFLRELQPNDTLVVDADTAPYKGSATGLQKELNITCVPLSLMNAIQKYPSLKADLAEFNPALLNKLIEN